MGYQNICVRNSFEEDEATKPIVALFGWAGGKMKYVSKYSSIFEEHGFTTVTLASPILPAYFSTGGFAKKRRCRIIRVLSQLTQKHKSRPIILMSFCQGGAMVMASLFNYLREEPTNKFNIVGTIFDSGPFNAAENSITVSQRALLASLGNPNIVTKSVCNKAVELLAKFSFATDEFSRNFDTNILQYPSLAPQLFLTSRADKIVDFRDVVGLAERRRERSVPVYLQVWDTGNHVELLRSHKDEYKQTIKDFIGVCIPMSPLEVIKKQKWIVELE